MLETAFQCFQSASRCDGDEEEWLIHYMLGKIAEKRKQTPKDYLQLYKQVIGGAAYEPMANLIGSCKCVMFVSFLVCKPFSVCFVCTELIYTPSHR